jgi:hypothetical protein
MAISMSRQEQKKHEKFAWWTHKNFHIFLLVRKCKYEPDWMIWHHYFFKKKIIARFIDDFNLSHQERLFNHVHLTLIKFDFKIY